MIIGVDARVLEKSVTGIGRILTGVINGLPIIDNGVFFYLFSNKPINAPNNRCQSIPTYSVNRFSKIFAPIWLSVILPRYLQKQHLDLFFAPNFVLPGSLKSKNIKSVVVIHDVLHRVHPEFQPFLYRIYLDRALKHSVRNADTIIADSECSKKDIIRYYNAKQDRIKVVYPFCEERFGTEQIETSVRQAIRAKYQLPNQYLLFVGVIEKRKNIETIATIHSKLTDRGFDIPVILVGRKGYGSKEILESVLKNPGIRYIDYVDDADLPAIYKMSKIFVFPSLYEGFGFPPLEAMKSGVPTITSNAGSLPEVIGTAAPQFDPYDVDGYADVIEQLLTNTEYYEKIKNSCQRRAEEFNRTRSLTELYQVFRNTLDG